MLRCALAVALVLSVVACQRRHVDSTQPPASTTSSDASSNASPTSSRLRARPIAAGYGGVGPATPAPMPNTWVVSFVSIETSAKLTGVFVARLELVDDTGSVVARGIAPYSLRLDGAPDGARQRGDFSEQGTTDFDGLIEPGRGLRLRIGAPLDTRSEHFRQRPARVRALVKASNDAGTWVDSPLQGPWPTG